MARGDTLAVMLHANHVMTPSVLSMRYIIRKESPQLYYAGPAGWTDDRARAYRFDFLLTAEVCALIELGVDTAFTVESIPVVMTIQ
jgi:hypothetical protein